MFTLQNKISLKNINAFKECLSPASCSVLKAINHQLLEEIVLGFWDFMAFYVIFFTLYNVVDKTFLSYFMQISFILLKLRPKNCLKEIWYINWFQKLISSGISYYNNYCYTKIQLDILTGWWDMMITESQTHIHQCHYLTHCKCRW